MTRLRVCKIARVVYFLDDVVDELTHEIAVTPQVRAFLTSREYFADFTVRGDQRDAADPRRSCIVRSRIAKNRYTCAIKN